jgi:DinB superfamily
MRRNCLRKNKSQLHNLTSNCLPAAGRIFSIPLERFFIPQKTNNMNLTAQIAKHFREVYFGGNWTSVNLKETLKDVTWQQATTKVYSFNTIAVLVYHINYYVSAVLPVLQGGALNASDKYSFDCPPILSQQDWEKLLDKTQAEAETFVGIIENLPESKLEETFSEEKYGNYYRNLHGIIEHTHYHLGQIVLIKKILLQADKN